MYNSIIDDISDIAGDIRKSNRSLNLGISIGMMCRFKDSRLNIKTLMDMADKALYYVKHHGKNDYCIKLHKKKIGQSSHKAYHLKLL